MKNLFYILSVVFVTLLSSCEVEEAQSSYPRTLEAITAYGYVEKSTNQSVFYLDLMTKVSYYGEAADNKKEGIKNYFLSGYTVTNTANTYTLKNSSEEIVFTHNNKFINELGAVWTMQRTEYLWDGSSEKTVDNKNFKVENEGNKNWKITTTDYRFYYQPTFKTNAVLDVIGSDAYDKSINLYDFKMSGLGNLDVNSVKLAYTIVEPLLYTCSKDISTLYIASGELLIKEGNDDINAKIIPSSNLSRVDITYKGITESF